MKKKRKKAMAKAMAKAKTMPGTELSDFWKRDPGIIRRFIEQHADYEQLCSEIQYILEKRLSKAGIEFSTVTSRAKTLNSFLEKLSRKKYEDPFSEITDLAGVRVVCLYIDDLQLVEDVINEEFILIEKVDKLNEKDPDQFGYGAIHYIVRLGKSSSGVRYDDLRDYVCEVQIRTVLQDAWAIIDHHLVYKRESAVPKALQRKLNSLAGLFETADDQFQRVRDEREKYITHITESKKSPDSFLLNETNLDSVRQYLSWKFPNLPLEAFEDQLSRVYRDIDLNIYPTLNEIDQLIEQEKTQTSKLFQKDKKAFALVDGKIPSSMNIGISLAFRHPDIRLYYDSMGIFDTIGS